MVYYINFYVNSKYYNKYVTYTFNTSNGDNNENIDKIVDCKMMIMIFMMMVRQTATTVLNLVISTKLMVDRFTLCLSQPCDVNEI